jgi:hypothetical protein
VRRTQAGPGEAGRGEGVTIEDKSAIDAVLELLSEIRGSKAREGRIEVTVCEGKPAKVRIVRFDHSRVIKVAK